MNKILLVIVSLLIFLSGCSSNDTSALATKVDEAITSALEVELPEAAQNNCTKTYYTYFQANGIGRGDADELSNQFTINGNSCCLTLDVSSIVSYIIYAAIDDDQLNDIGSLEDAFYSTTGTLTNSSDEELPYKVEIAEGESNSYLALIQTHDFVFVAYIDQGDCADTIYQMMFLLRTIVVDRDEVVLAYGSSNIVESTTSVITLFDEVIPESGYVEDYIEDWQNTGNYIIIDNSTDSSDSGDLFGSGSEDDEELDEWADIEENSEAQGDTSDGTDENTDTENTDAENTDEENTDEEIQEDVE